MNKLLKMLGMALLVATMFSCSIEDSSGWKANVGDTFEVARINNGTSTTFDFTGLGLNDTSLLSVYTSYVTDTETNSNMTLLFAGVSVDDDGVDPAFWEVDSGSSDNEIEKDGVVSSVYKQTFDHNLNTNIDFNIDDKAIRTLISVVDPINKLEYFLQGEHNGNGLVTLIEIEQD